MPILSPVTDKDKEALFKCCLLIFNRQHELFCDTTSKRGSGSTRPGTNSAPESTRPGQLGLFIFLMVNWDITYVPNKEFGRYDLEYAR